MSGWERFDAWAFAPVPHRRLVVWRALVCGFAVGYLAVRVRAFAGLVDRSPGEFRPIGVLSPLRGPLPDAVWIGVLVVSCCAGVAAALGVGWRVSGPVFALGFLVATTYRSSWGQVLHHEQLLVLHLLVLACAAGAGGSLLRRGSRGCGERKGWALPLCAAITVASYVVAGIAKLRIGGWDWIAGDALRHHVAYSAVRLDLLGEVPSPLARPIVAQRWTSTPLAVITLVLELGAPAALLGRRWAIAWIAGTWLLHAAIAAAMFVVFPYQLSGLALLPVLLASRPDPAPIVSRNSAP